MEILVTMLIMAVGLLGVAALQFKGLQYNHDAYVRSQVNFLAYDIADRIRLNRANAAAYTGNHNINPAVPLAACDPSLATAANDLNCWRAKVYESVPSDGGEANITSAGNIFKVELKWTDKGNQPRTISYSFQP